MTHGQLVTLGLALLRVSKQERRSLRRRGIHTARRQRRAVKAAWAHLKATGAI